MVVHKDQENEERSIVQSLLVGPRKKWDFDLGICITKMQRHHMGNEEEDEEIDELDGDEDRDQDFDTFVSVKEVGLSINRVFTKKKHP